jgi:signal transduction histidine kinase
MGCQPTSRGLPLRGEGNHSRRAEFALVMSTLMTPAATVAPPSTTSSLARAEPGFVLAALYLGVGVLGYLAGPTPLGGTLPVLWAALAIGVATALVLRRPTPLPATVAPWVCPALVGPVALYPLFAPVLGLGSPILTALAAALLAGATLPMVLAIARLTPGATGNLVRAAVPALGLAAAFVVILPFTSDGLVVRLGAAPDAPFAAATGWLARLLVVAVLVWPPAVTFTVLFSRGRTSGTQPAGEVLSDAALLVVGFGPLVTASGLFIPWIYALSLVGFAALVVFAAFRVAVRPLAAISARAAAQRDLALTASEGERARLAADLHDGPLQDLLILARTLEAREDADGAQLARDVADELRELSGDLRLPVLDDLGLGPALDWLAGRMRRLTGLDVAADCHATGRLPREVELAAFRVAQEAVSNAVRHGRPPIRIRLSAGPGRLALTIEDAGDGRGFESPAILSAPDGVRRGMIGMGQRAEQIGASLEVRRGEGLGTLVVLEWEERT